MARWISLLNLQGIYTSPSILIPLQADGALSKVSWESSTPGGSQIVVQTRLSFDAVNWTEWRACTNGGQIPEVNEDTPLHGTYIMYRVIMKSNSYSIKPKFKKITFFFEPVLVFDNKGDLNCKPEIWITKLGNGDFSIQNITHSNEEFAFTNLLDGETVYVDNENQDIETTLAVTYRYKDFNDNYLNFPPGKNVLRVSGNADIKFRYQYTLL
ncbi:phage tail family protein [Paenibacillus bouchesdurhonensis]|uniref:phage tail domain-containing protein n=1 Tax=Paenibacillus bouchesdurhonensis TaxID=1870990 RepID=UPI000DA63F61|nr:phage tail domain-containing protein [Paenibacillus bouchesdurhonensis]